MILPVLFIEFAYFSFSGFNLTFLMLVILFFFYIFLFMIRVKYQDCYIDRSVVSAIVVGVQLYLSVVDRRTEILATGGVQVVIKTLWRR